MSTRKQSPRTRAFRPEADNLEDRQLLSALVSGTDSKGDAWTLRLIGPGSLSVVKQIDSTGQPAALNSATDINTITIGGTDPKTSRLVGTVVPAAGSDGRVYFQTMTGLPGRSEKFSGAGLGLVGIQMPGFWLGNTTTGGATSGGTTASITLPDGVDTLQLGGIDTKHNQPAALPNANTDDAISVKLGLPAYGGTRIILGQSISSTQVTQSSTSGGTTTPGKTIQHGVIIAVAGRLDLFQANQIVGDAANPPGQFKNENSAASGTGGTILFSGTAQTTNFFPSADLTIKGQVTGQIGDVRIGGNATNFTTIVNDGTQSGNDRISNYSVGGETNNVMVLAPAGLNNAVFGKGMDTTEIRTHVIKTLKANRGALNSNVVADRSISQVNLGGDVVNTKILTGFQENHIAIFDAVTGTSTSIFSSATPAPPPDPIAAQIGGGMTIHVAGSVTNSVFAASVQPFNNVYGDPNQLVLPGGHIKGKIEGTISNTTTTPNATTNKAFFASQVNQLAGPVIPPNVPEPPYTGKTTPTHLPGINPALNHTVTATAKTVHTASVLHVTHPVKTAKTTKSG